MSINGSIPDPQLSGTMRYATEDPVSGDSPGIIVPPAVLAVLMKTSAALAPKPSAPPPHPQVTQQLSAIPLGYQFAFNQLVSPTPYGNTIAAYRIYRNKSANAFSGAQLIRTIIHDPTHQGAVTVQDSTGGNVNYFYFVTAVDSTGQESSQPGAFQSSPVVSGNANPNIHSPTPSTAGPSTSSTTYVVIPEMTTSFTSFGNKILLVLTMQATTTQTGGTGNACNFAFFRDGVQITTDFAFVNAGIVGAGWTYCFSFLDAAPAGSHTWDARWKVATINATITTIGIQRTFQVIELG